jgi:3-methyladenine DNA glycosylase AlkC
MPEAFKNNFNAQAINALGAHLSRVAPNFDAAAFETFCLADLEPLELKERSSHITDGLAVYLPAEFPLAAKILIDSLAPSTNLPFGDDEDAARDPRGVRGWMVMPMADFIARNGQSHLDISLLTLKEMTKRFTSEFAIRAFLIQHEAETLQILSGWVQDESQHVRRLVSEGVRPRLPWGVQLPRFMKDPTPIIPFLESLKDDEELYVRRSVANNLNDIAKDNPDTVAGIASRWLKNANPARRKLVRHGLRSLIKSGHPEARKALGYHPPKIKISDFSLRQSEITLGDSLHFDIEITSTAPTDQPLIIDYIVHHMRANGVTTPKVFKWKEITLKGGATHEALKRHPIRAITTRKYYTGSHRVELLINGEKFGDSQFHLTVPQT